MKTAVSPERETGTVARVLLVLRAIAEMTTAPTMKELADHLNLPLSTMHRLLDMLAEDGMVERDDNGKTFHPGLDFFRIASLVVHRMPVKTLARTNLQQATRETNESAYLALLDARANKLIFAASAESSHLLDYRVPINVPFSLAVGASGLAILAWLDQNLIDQAIDVHTAEASAAGGKAPARKTVLKSLTVIRAQGYAHTFGQRIKGAVGIFAPVFQADGRVCASFGFTVPQVRYEDAFAPRLSAAAMRHASNLSRALGFSGTTLGMQP